MSDPQQSPPYAPNTGQDATPGYPAQPTYPGQPQYNAQHQYSAQPQQSAQPQYSGQHQYAAQPPYGAQSGYQTPPASVPGATNANLPGRLGFIIGLVGLGVGLLFNLIFQATIRTGGWQIASFLNTGGSLLALVAAVLALVFGIIGLRRVGAPHGQAGIAVGLGIAGIAGGLYGTVLGALSSLFYY